MTFSSIHRSTVHFTFIAWFGCLQACVLDYQVGHTPQVTDSSPTGDTGSSTNVSTSTSDSGETGPTDSTGAGPADTDTETSSDMPGVMLGTCEFVDQPPNARCDDGALQPGDFCFGSSSSPQISRGIASMLTLSLDGDGAPDFLLSDDLAIFAILNRPGELYYTTFTWPKEQLPPGMPTLVGSGDLDGDGDDDVVIREWTDTETRSHVLFLDGKGQIASTALIGTSMNARRVLDWDGDGNLDIVLHAGDGMQVARGDGAGGFTLTPAPNLTDDGQMFIGALDADGASNDTIYGAGTGWPKVIHVVGDEAEYYEFDLPEELYPWTHAIADLDHDGLGDIVVLAWIDSPASSIEIVVALQADDFALTRYPVPCNALNIAVGDLDGDGSPDIAALSGDQLTARRNDGAGGFLEAVNIPADFHIPDDVAIVDVNGDGAGDVVGVQGSKLGVFINEF